MVTDPKQRAHQLTAGECLADDEGEPLRPICRIAEDLLEGGHRFLRLDLHAAQIIQCQMLVGRAGELRMDDGAFGDEACNIVFTEEAAHRDMDERSGNIDPDGKAVVRRPQIVRRIPDRDATVLTRMLPAIYRVLHEFFSP
ncbi:hypothetical protein U1839_26280 [Sphingomonas sp. RT2P30]|uniref:hypothetical protein n=1 Tax=Parasphingomonas halimpatiens TaxID=3096162 RepID=UPI002FC7241D